MSHNDAVAFLGWLNKQENEKKPSYRLPTEAEWEYACRAGSQELYGADDDPKSLVRVANIAGDADGFKCTSPVGSFEPNAWHLYDMIGNVWEWCDDWYGAKFYPSSPKENPHNIAAGSYRVFRGGSWYNTAEYCRAAYRYWLTPTNTRPPPGFATGPRSRIGSCRQAGLCPGAEAGLGSKRSRPQTGPERKGMTAEGHRPAAGDEGRSPRLGAVDRSIADALVNVSRVELVRSGQIRDDQRCGLNSSLGPLSAAKVPDCSIPAGST